MTDVIVVGSGASAVHAACPLVEAGLRTLMLDVGHRDARYAPLIPDRPFSSLRREDPDQHRYLLGDDFEGIPFGGVRVGAQLTPPRAFITRDTAEWTPVDAPAFAGLESLAMGGLAAGWGAGVGRFTAQDLARTPLTPAALEPHYRTVEARIGVCGERDDLSQNLGDHATMMPPLKPDTASAAMLDRYHRHRADFHRAGLRLGITRLAACSRPFNGRGPHRYDDLDFWADKARAVYRPAWTLEELQNRPGFAYLTGRLVMSFEELPGAVRIHARNLETRTQEVHEARAVVLAAGVFGTARIVLRSLGLYDHPIPFISNPYTYSPCLNVNMLGREPDDARHSLSQITATYTPAGEPHQLHLSVYSYRSLLTFKLIKETPLGARSAIRLMRALIPMLSIVGIHHDDAPSPRKHLSLRRDTRGGPDRLVIAYGLDDEQAARIDRHERSVLRLLRRLGCWSLRRIRAGHGSSIHYGGTFPMSAEPGPLRSTPDGRLAGTERVYLADGSVFPDLPAKGPTFTFMANADRVGTLLARTLQ
jgi:choline dehydrogenase-like flavoprotein